MAKTIKFDLPIDGVKVATLDGLRDHFTTETIGHFRSGLLARWLRSRSMTRELAAVEALKAGDDAAVLKELCGIFGVEADGDAIAAAVAEATGVPGVRPDQVRRRRERNPGDTFRDCPECPEMVVVPSGSFMMGSPEEEEGRVYVEGPLHEVRIDYPLAVGVYAVTFDEWDACVSAGGCDGYRPGDAGWGRGTRPVINVSWDDAQLYLKWLCWKTGKGYRLLSESEWEYVARAGTTGAYHFGSSMSLSQANFFDFSDLAHSKTAPVGSYPANPFGLHDVHGNVWEWVEDAWNVEYEGAPSDGSAWTSGEQRSSWRVMRGGSWDDGPGDLRSASREYGVTDQRKNPARHYFNNQSDYGFRVARTLTP